MKRYSERQTAMYLQKFGVGKIFFFYVFEKYLMLTKPAFI